MIADRDSKPHYLPYAFPTQTVAGGLGRAIVQHAATSDSEVILFTTDKADYRIGNSQVLAAAPVRQEAAEAYTKWWSGTGGWQYIFPHAHLAPQMPDYAIPRIYGKSSPLTPGTEPHLLDYLRHHAPGPEVAAEFAARYRGLLEQVKPNSSFHWQDFFLLPLMPEWSARFKEMGVTQTMHLHTSVPTNLYKSEWGREFLTALSMMDGVFVHAPQYVERLRSLLAKCGCKIPSISTFELGTDQGWLESGLKSISTDNYERTIPDFQLLDARQQGMIREVVRTRGDVKHRFLDIDRADATKGHLVVLDAIDRLLEERLQTEGMEGLRANYRFFFLCRFVDFGPYNDDPGCITACYGKLVRERFDEMEAKWPGIVWRSDPLAGNRANALPFLMQGCHALSGAVEEGLNLAVIEALVSHYIGRGRQPGTASDPTMIVGDNAGISLIALGLGYHDAALFPRSGSTDAFYKALTRVVDMTDRERAELSRGTTALVEDVMLPRKPYLTFDLKV